MAADKELFKLFGLIGMQGVEKTQSQIKGIDKQVRKTQKELDRLGKRVTDVGKVLTKAFTLPLLAAAAASKTFVDDATDLNETISKTGELFGASAKDIEAWAETSATAIGQSKQQAMDAAGTFAIFGKSAGLAGKELVDFSTEFVELASDMASFFNTEPEEAITAIGAAFRGETEPIRKYGVLLDDATMRQKAFELGLITSTKNALMPQTKVLAAQALILEQTKTAQGDFARTSAGLANQQRILAAQWKNMSATLGQLFLPAALKIGQVLSRLIGFAEKLIDKWKGLSDSTRRTIKGFLVIAAAIGPVVIVIGKLIAWSKLLIPLLVALKAGTLSYAGAVGVLSKSVLGITLLIGALVALGWFWYSQWETMSVQLQALWAKIELFILKGANAMLQTLADLAIGSLKLLDKISGVIPGLGGKIKKATIDLLKFKAAMFGKVGEQQAFTNSINDQAVAMGSFTDTLKKAVKEGKEALGIKEESTKKTQKQIELEKLHAKEIEDKAEKAKEAAEKIKQFNQDVQDQINEFRLSEMEQLQIEKDRRVQQAFELGADTLAVKELFVLKEQELRNRIRAEEEEKDRKALQDRLAMGLKFGNKLNSVLGKFHDNRIRRIDNAEKREIEAIENSSRTEEEKEAAIAKVRADADKKRRQAQREQAIREKLAALFNIGVNTASAVVEALPNIPLSLLIGALGAAEAVAVATAPLPFFEGGFVQGTEGGVNALVGEGNQDELVFPLERGIDLLINGIFGRLSEIELPTLAGAEPAFAAGGGEVRDVHLHIGTFIGDERGLKQLERKLDTIRIAENQRKGF